jgi:hypothetical protein
MVAADAYDAPKATRFPESPWLLTKSTRYRMKCIQNRRNNFTETNKTRYNSSTYYSDRVMSFFIIQERKGLNL